MTTAVVEKQEAKKTSEQKQIYSPPVTIYENDESYVVFVALSGVDDKTVQVRVDKGILTIEASLNLELPDGATAKYTEVRLGDCRRSLNIGDEVDQDQIEASFKSGLLKLTLAKNKNARARKIPIKNA